MRTLAIETATQQLGVALSDGDRVVSSYALLAEHPHAVELPDAVTRVLKAARTTLTQVEAIAVDIGPGSFTGLRIGIAFVKAIAFAMKKTVVGVPSLDVLAANLPFTSRLICPLLDAKQRNVYAALFRQDDGRLKRQTDYLLEPVDAVLSQIKAPAIFLGDGCARYRDQIVERLGADAAFAAQELWLPRAETLARLGVEHLRQGQRDDPAGLIPLYLYPQDASIDPRIRQAIAAGQSVL
jgi:tRNA threonylcarbamoyladenosine biosynthesis protein TsaB